MSPWKWKEESRGTRGRLKLELTKGSSSSSGSVADEIESVGSRRNQERTGGWAESVAQQSFPRRPLSPNVVIDPPTNVTQQRVDKRFSTYPKTTPLFQTGEGLFSLQLTEPSILRKPKIRKPNRVTQPQAPLTRRRLQQQGTSAVQPINRSQSSINISRNNSAESRDKLNYSSSHLPNSTEQWCQWPAKTKADWVFRRPPGMARVVKSFWCGWSSKANQRYRKDAKPQDQSHESSKSSNIENGIQLTIILSCLGYTLWEVWQIICHSQRAIQENTYSSSNSARRFYENCPVCKCGYKCGEHLDSTWIHIRLRSWSILCKIVDYWEETLFFSKNGLTPRQ